MGASAFFVSMELYAACAPPEIFKEAHMAILQINNLSFGYDDELIFEHLTLSLDTDWKLGFIGRNGRGKTTLLRLLAGELTPQEGGIKTSAHFAVFPFPMQEGALAADAVRECASAEDWRLERELNRLDVDAQDVLWRPVSTLSGGERTKLQLAALFAADDPSFLLIDEPTNHLDALGRAAVGDYLASKSGFLMVSHDRAFLDRSVDHILSLQKTGMMIEQGNYSTYAFNQARRDEWDTTRNERLEKDIRKMEESQRAKRQWSDNVEKGKIGSHSADRGAVGHMAAKGMKRALSIQTRQQRMIDEKKELLQDLEYASKLTLETLPHDKKVFLAAENLSLGYGGIPVVSGLHFQLGQGERLAVVGPNGAGKTTLLKAVLGNIAPLGGRLSAAPRLVVSHIAQDTTHLRGDVRDFALERGAELSRFLMLLRKLDFRRSTFELPIQWMSEGQKKKLLIAASLCTPAHLYLWDEPLNYVDVLSRVQIEELIVGSSATILMVEHDETFLDRIGARRLNLIAN